MPIKITDLKAVPANITPSYNLPGVRAINGYDKGFREEMNQEWNRANNQSWYDQLGKGLVSRGLSIGPKFVAGVGSVLGATSALFTHDMTDIWDNPIVNAMNELDDSLRESLPIYKSKKYAQGDLWSMMGTTGFWFDDGFDGIAFLASAYGGSEIGKGIASGVRGLGKVLPSGKGVDKLAKFGESVMTPLADVSYHPNAILGNLAGSALQAPKKLASGLRGIGFTAHQGDLIAATAYNTIAEAGAEAYQTNKEIRDLLYDLRDTNPEYASLSDDDIKKRAGKAAAETFWWNSAVLAIPNFVQARMMHGSFKDKSDVIRKAIWGNKGDSAQAMKELSSRWGAVAEGIASEGLWEENIQTAIQQYERNAGTNLKDNNLMAEEIAMNYANGIKGFVKSFLPGFTTNAMENESAVSILLGGVIGGGMGLVSSARENRQLQKAIGQEKGRYNNLFTKYGPAAESLFVDIVKSIFQQNGTRTLTTTNENGETQEIEVPNYQFEGGTTKKDGTALMTAVVNQLRNKHLFDAQMVAAYRNDPLMDIYNNEVALAAFVHDLITKGYTPDEIAQYASEMAAIGSQEAQDLGVATTIQENMEQVKSYAKMLEDIGSRNKSKEDLETEDIRETRFKSFLNKTEFYANVKKNALEKIRKETTNEDTQASIDTLLEDVNGVLEQIKNDKKGIREEYMNTVDSTVSRLAEINHLENKKDRTDEEQKKLQALQYLQLEDAAINGKFALQNVSHANTYGATTKQLVETKPGIRSEHYYTIGRQSLAVEQAKQNVAAGEDALTTLEALTRPENVAIPDSEFSEVAEPLANVLIDQEDQLTKGIEGIAEITSEIETFINPYEGLTVKDLSEEAREFLSEHDLLPKDNNGVVDMDGQMDLQDPDVVEKYIAAMSKLESDWNQSMERKNKISSVLDRYDALENTAEEFKNHVDELRGPKAEEYLIEKYFEDQVASIAEKEIKRFENNPEAYDDLRSVNAIMELLQAAKAAFEYRDGEYQSILDKINELLDIYTTKIRPQVIENKESRRAKQLDLNNEVCNHLLYAIGIHPNRDDNEVEKLLRDTLGSDKVDEVLQTFKGTEILSYDGVLAIINAFQEKASEEDLQKFKDEIRKELGGILSTMEKELKDNIKEKLYHPPKGMLSPMKMFDGRSAYEVNPQSTMVSLLKRLFGSEIAEQRTSAYKYAYDHDLLAFSNAIDSDTGIDAQKKEVFHRLYGKHLKASELSKVLRLLEGDLKNMSKIVAVKEELEGIAPTPQQNIILSEALAFFTDGVPTNQSSYQGWMLIKGIAGSGKSFVVGKLLTNLMQKINPQAKGYAFSARQHTSDNINKAVFGNNNENRSLEKFLALKDEELSKLDFIIIDEIFTLTKAQLTQVKDKLAKHHSDTKKNIKVFALGDPSQSGADNTTTHELMTNAAAKSVQTFAMSVSYRTNVGAISSFLGNYLLNPEDVTKAFAQSNMTLEESTQNPHLATGVRAGSLEQLHTLLNTPSSRSRVVIVGNEIDRSEMQKIVPAGVAVETYGTAQGYQWDEVYTYLDNGTIGESPIERNRNKYTAFSRAKEFLFVVDPTVQNINPDPSMSSSIEEDPKDLEQNKVDFQNSMGRAKEVIRILTGTAPVASPVVTPTEITVEDDVESFDAGPTNPEIIPVEDQTGIDEEVLPFIPVTSKDGKDTYEIAHPTNYNLREAAGRVSKGDTVHVVRAKDGKGKDYYYMVVNTNGNNYVVVGMLGNKDFKHPNMKDRAEAYLKTKPTVFIPKDLVVQTGFTINNIDNVSLGTGTLEGFTPLGNSYMRDSEGNLIYTMSSTMIEDAIRNFYKTFFGPDSYGRRTYPDSMLVRDAQGNIEYDKDGNPRVDAKKEWVDGKGKINWNIVGKHAKVVIFDRKNAPSGVYPGLPYIEITDPRQLSTTKTTKSKNIHIPLQPRKFSKTSPLYAPIRKLYENLAALGALDAKLLLGSPVLKDHLETVAAKNFTLKDVGGKFQNDLNKRFEVQKSNNSISLSEILPNLSKEQIAEADKLVEELIPLIFGVGLKGIYMDTEEEAKAAVGTVIEGKKVVSYKKQSEGEHEKFVLRYQADSEGEDVRVLKVHALRAGKGEAQKALNKLAQANRYIADGSGIKAQIRIENQAKRRKEDALEEFSITRAKSILSTNAFVDYAEIYDLHPEWGVTMGQFKNRDRLKAHLLKEGKVTSEEFENIMFNNTSQPMTLPILEHIVGDQFYDEQDNHTINGFFLREPLDSRTPQGNGINDKGVNLSDAATRGELNQLLSTAYTGTQQTRVSISFAPIVEQQKKEGFEPTDTVTLFDNLPEVSDPNSKAVLNLLRKAGQNVVVRYSKLAKVNSGKAAAFNNETGVILFNYDPLAEPTEGDTYLLMHETLHANLNNAIARTLSPNVEATEREELFTQRMLELNDLVREYAKKKKISIKSFMNDSVSKHDVYEFVANLGHPPFIKVLKEIKIKKQSVLSKVIDAILDLLGLSESTAYDVMFAAVEDFLTNTQETKADTKELTRLEKKFKSIAKHTNKADQKFYSSIYDFEKNEFTDVYSSYPTAKKIETLKDFIEPDTPIDDNLYYGFYNEPGVFFTSSPGSLVTNQSIFKLYEATFGTIENPVTKNLLATILSVQVKDPGSKLLSNLLHYAKTDNIEDAVDMMIDEVLTSSDIRKIATALNAEEWGLAQSILNNEDMSTPFKEVMELLKQNEEQLDVLLETSDLHSSRKYEAAYNYVMQKIRENEDPVFDLIQTKGELLDSILNNLRNSTKVVDELQRKLDQKIALAKAMASEATTPKDFAELRKILEFEIPAAEQKLAGVSALTKVNNRTRRILFYDIVSDIYPKNKFTEDADLQIFADNMIDLPEEYNPNEVEDSSGISEHIKEYNKSYELTLSEALKNYLSLVEVKGRLLNPSLVYIKTMQYLTSIATDNVDVIKKEITKTLEDRGLSDVDRAIYLNLQKIISTATNNYNANTNTELPTNIGIISERNRQGIVYYKGVSSSKNVTGYTTKQAENDPNAEISKPFTRSQDLFNWLNKKQSIDYSEYNGMFARTEAINLLRELQNSMASMKETDLMIGTRTNRKGVEVAYIKSKAMGVNVSAKQSVKQGLEYLYKQDKLKTISGQFKLINPEAQAAVFGTKNDASIEEKKEGIKAFLDMLGLSSLTPGLSIADEEVTDLIESIIFLAKKAKEVDVYSKEKEVSESELADQEFTQEEEGAAQPGSFEYFLNDMDGKINMLADLASRSSIYLRNPSVRTSDGDKFYKYHESSWGYDVYQNLIRMKSNSIYQGTKGGNELRIAPEHLSANFYDHNIFKTGLSKLFFIAEHEAIKNTDIGNSTTFKRESKYHYFHREFVQGFLDGARQYQGNSFFMFNYTPADKPKVPVFRVSLLNDRGENNQIKQALKSSLLLFIEKEGVMLDVAYYSKSNREDRFRNFTLAGKAEEELKQPLTKDNVDAFVEKMHELLTKEAEELTNQLMDIELTLDVKTFTEQGALGEHLRRNINERYDENVKGGTKFTNYNNKVKPRKYAVRKEQLLPLVDLYLKNHYVNSFHLQQLAMGDYAAYKNVEAVVKRIAGVYAPGIRGLVDPNIGMKEKFKTLVLKDTSIPVEKTEERLRALLFGQHQPNEQEEKDFKQLIKLFKDYDIADAQGFMLPSRFADMERGFGRDWGLGNVMKPVHFELVQKKVVREDGTEYTTAIPVYLKYSSIVLEDSLVKKFPMLSKLRARLEQLGVDELIFHTGVKTGIPLPRTEEDGYVNDLTFEKFMEMEDVTELNTYLTSPILELSNKHFRLQHNPATNPRKNIAIFTQLMYFLNVYENTFDSAREAYSHVAELIKMGRDEFFDELKLKSFLYSKFNGPGAERALELLRAGVSLDNPLLEKKAIVAIASELESKTVKVKFAGGKLVLQTPQGIQKYYDPELFNSLPKEAEELSYKTEIINGTEVTYAEVIVPQELLTPEMLEAVRNKKSVFMFGDGMGFRIPSSELHSAVPLRVVGVYSNTATNVIIAPKELIPIHGSDHDVDSLQIIIREVYSKDDLSQVTPAKLTSLIDSLVALKDLVAGIKEGMSEKEANIIEQFRNLILDKLELTKSLDEQYEAESNIDFQDKLFQEYRKEVRNNSRLTIEQFAADRGYTYENEKFKISSELTSDLHTLKQEIESFEQEHSDVLNKNAQIKKAFAKQKSLIEKVFTKDSIDTRDLDKPIGYKKDGAHYVVDEEYGENLTKNIEELEALVETANSISPKLASQVKAEVKRQKKTLQKYLRNRILEVMLHTITSRDNLTRIVSPITFTPLKNAILQIDSSLLPNRKLDLSNPMDKYKSYQSLSEGDKLTGGFANAVKVYGYTSRSGTEDQLINQLYKDLAGLDLQISTARRLNESTRDLQKQRKRIATNLKEALASSKNEEARPYLHPAYAFNYSVRGVNRLFNQMKERDVNNEYSVTTVFDSLSNAAIDNLNEGILPDMRVNSITGSAVMGLLSVGLPIDNIVPILYSPVLEDLSSGKVTRVSKWMQGIEEKYQEQLKNLAENPVKLSDSKTLKEANKGKSLETLSPEELQYQLAIFELFKKAYKIGEDIKGLASFLDIVRKVNVFIEDIDNVDYKLHNQIGRVDEVSGEMVLVPRSDFSLVIPNLFRNNPHISQAYESHLKLTGFIGENFRLHSPFLRKIVENSGINDLQNSEEVDSTIANLARARAAISHMLLSNIVWDKGVSTTPNKVITIGNNKKLILSKGRSFTENVAEQLQLVKKYYENNKSKFPISNKFLDLTSVSKDYVRNTMSIRLAGGVNLNSIDIQDIAKGFKMLNQFVVENGEVIQLPPNSGVSQLQRDLLTFAVLNYGLNFSTSNFSNVIDTRLIKALDEEYGLALTQLLHDLKETDFNVPFREFFQLSYHMQNADRLGYVDFSRVQVTKEIKDAEGKTIQRIYSGMDEVMIDEKLTPIHYDRKLSNPTKLDKAPNPKWFSVDFNKKTEIYVRVATTGMYTYYQKVGKASEAYYTKLQDREYSIPKYFDPRVASIPYNMTLENNLNPQVGDKITLLSNTPIDDLKQGDTFFAFPIYNFDRQERVFVKLISKQTKLDKKYRSFQYEVEVLETPSYEEYEIYEAPPALGKFTWARTDPNGYEVSTTGDTRFSALNAKLEDGRTIEEAYQLDVKGYRSKGDNWKLGKNKPPLTKMSRAESWEAYLDLWRQWAEENPGLIEDLRNKAKGKVLTDEFAKTDVSQARALSIILNETDAQEVEEAPSSRKTYSGLITKLDKNQIFVFGSNPIGVNGNPAKGTGGAALAALKNGWVEQGEKMDNKLSDSGKAWGITTVERPGARRSKSPEQIKEGIATLYAYAKNNPEKEFLVAYTGTSGRNLNGYSNSELALLFSSQEIPNNIVFEEEFATLLNEAPPTESYAYYMEELNKENEKNIKSTEDKMGYTIAGSNTKVDSVTGVVIPAFKNRQFAESDMTLGEKKAEKLWQGKDAKELLDTNMGEALNKLDYIQAVDEAYTKGIAKGTIFHKVVHYYFNPSKELGEEIANIISENNFTPGEFDWIYENIGGIVNKTGTDYFKATRTDQGMLFTENKNANDKIFTEVKLASKILGMGGTADMIIDHGDDLYSIFDMKTGSAFDRLFEYDMFKYGTTAASTDDIFDTPRNRAKLQVMLYALMLKIQRPEARFRTLELLHIRNRFSIYDKDHRKNINYPAYLEMIEKYLKNKKPKVYKELQALPHFKSLFNPKSYGVVSRDILTKQDVPPAEDLKLKTLHLQQLIMRRKNLEEDVSKGIPEAAALLKEIETLIGEIIELRKAPNMDFASWDEDISWMDRWLGSPSMSTNPYVQLYYKQLSEAKDTAEAEIQQWKREYDSKLKPVVKEYYEKSGLSLSEFFGKITKDYIGGINKQKLFAPFYKVEERDNTTDKVTRLLTRNDIEYKTLSTAEQSFLDFVNESIAKFFKDSKSDYIDPKTGKKVAVANKIATIREFNGEEVELSNLDLFNGKGSKLKAFQFKYYDGFLPKLHPTLDDIKHTHGAYSAKMLEFLKLKYTSNYYEAMYDGWFSTDEAIPMKYLDTKESIANQNYSTDLDHIMNNFVRQYTYKQHLDEVYAFGTAMRYYLIAKEETDSNINYEKLVDWFENSVNLHVLGRKQQDLKMTRRDFRMNTTNGFKRFNWPKFLRSLKSFFSASTMWLKPVSGTANFIFASLYTLKEGIRSSLGNKLYGTDKDAADFGILDIAKGYAAAFKMLVVDSISGNLEKNKLYQLMLKYRYFNDSYDWYTSPNKLVTAKNKLFDTKSMYFFHSFPEEIVSAAIFHAQLNSMKTEDGKSLYDHYDVEDVKNENGELSYALRWDGYVRGERNVSNVDGITQLRPVTELEPEEVIAIRQVYERMHGGYKSDERTALEYYVMGELALQFKKYLPSILKMGFASKGIRQQQGSLQKDENGHLVWTPSIIEGRFRTLGNVLLNIVGSGRDSGGNKLMEMLRLQKNASYDWKELSREQKDNLLDATVTLFFFMLMLFGYTSMWDDDDQDASKKVYGRIMNDFAGQWYLPELVKNTANLSKPIVADKMVKTLASGTQFGAALMFDLAGYDDRAFTKQGNYRGSAEFSRHVPFLASWHDAIKFARESENSNILEIRLK